MLKRPIVRLNVETKKNKVMFALLPTIVYLESKEDYSVNIVWFVFDLVFEWSRTN